MASQSSSPRLNQLENELMEVGKRLLVIPSSTEKLLNLLEGLKSLLLGLQQLPSKSVQYAMQPSIEALIAKELVSHPDMDVKISVASCICEILRIMAPEAPYDDEQMKEFFQLAVQAFEKLSSASGACYSKIVTVLKTFGNIRLSVLMLDLQLDDLIFSMFQQFFNAAESNCSGIVPEMEKVMTMIIEESEQLTLELITLLVTRVKKENHTASPLSWLLGEKVLKNCAVQLKPYLPDAVRHTGIALHDYAEVVAFICDEASGNVNDTLIDNAVQMRKGKLVEGEINTNSQAEYTEASAVDNKGTNAQTKRNKRKIKPNPLIQKSEGYDYTGKVFLTRGWKDHERKILSSCENTETSSRTKTEGKGKCKRTPKSPRKEASTISKTVEDPGENLVGIRVRVWWPLDETFYDGVITSFESSTKKHKVHYTDGKEESLHLKKERWELVEDLGALPDSGTKAAPVSTPLSLQADSNCQTKDLQLVVALPIVPPRPETTVDVQGYKVKASTAPILESIFRKHGNIAVQCIFQTSSVRASFLEVVCEVIRRMQTNDVAAVVSEMKAIENEVSEAEAANIDVSWLRPHLEAFCRRKEAMQRSSQLIDTKANTVLANRTARKDLRERRAELEAAQERVKDAERLVKALDLVEKTLNCSILESKAEESSWTRPEIV